jgi:arsenite methyltransferase
MTDIIEFDAAAAERIEAMYLTTDVIEQRLIVQRALDLRADEHVLDIGSGPGLLVLELARSVGPGGRVCGLDPSEPMLEMGRRRCEGLPQCDFEQADANVMPFEDGTFDAVVSTQVYEYVADIPAAFAELYRVVKPGGRVCIVDTDYDSLVIHTEEPERMGRVLEAWDAHFVHADLPRKIAPALSEAGFRVGHRAAVPMFNPEWHANAFSHHLLPLMGGFAVGRGAINGEEMTAWVQEFEALGRRGAFFFSLNRYLFTARKPG